MSKAAVDKPPDRGESADGPGGRSRRGRWVQAGLAVSHELTGAAVEHVVLERGSVGSTWRDRWDYFCLVTPNWLLRLPGYHYDGDYDGDDPDGFLPARSPATSPATPPASRLPSPTVSRSTWSRPSVAGSGHHLDR